MEAAGDGQLDGLPDTGNKEKEAAESGIFETLPEDGNSDKEVEEKGAAGNSEADLEALPEDGNSDKEADGSEERGTAGQSVADLEALPETGKDGEITKISQVTPEVTWFLRTLGLTNYYIIKIFNLVGDACQALIEDNPYWLLEEFPRMGFARVDEIAHILGVSDEDRNRIEAGILLRMRFYTGEGHVFADYDELVHTAAETLGAGGELVEDVIEDMVFDGRLQLADVDGRRVVYFYGYYKAECGIASALAALENPDGGLAPVGGDMDALIAKAEAEAGVAFSPEQAEAVRNAMLAGVSIITGGPGTGKTTIINGLIAIAEASKLKVALAAPTGRAAKRIMETTKHFACTVHRLLEYYYDEMSHYMAFGRNSEKPLEQDIVIIDEASMLDLLLMEALCDALRPGVRLILVGDSDQLPSVGAGNVLADLINSEYFFTARLTQIYRQSEASAIVLNAHRINRGEYPKFEGDFKLTSKYKQKDIVSSLVEIARQYDLENMQVISPTKKGIVGTHELNKAMQEAFNPAESGRDELKFGSVVFRVGDRVMQIKNDYRLEYRVMEESGDWRKAAPLFKSPDGKPDGKGVFNGEIGTVAAIDTEHRTVTVVYDGCRWVEYQYMQLEEIELAYAITVHKSQGSEFGTVIIPMTWFPPMLATRSLIYTAITRAKNEVYIIGTPSYLNAMVDNNASGSRNSGLSERLVGLYRGME